MNKIRVVIEKKIEQEIDNSIIINDYSKVKDIDDKNLFIYIPKNTNTNLELSIEDKDTYHDIYIMVDDNSILNLTEYKIFDTDDNYKYTYIIKDNSKLIINKFNNIKSIKEEINVNLNGINSCIEFNLSTITNHNQEYLMDIKHNNLSTTSLVTNHGITLDNAKLEFNINGIVPKNIKNCLLNQDNKIITMGDNFSIIKPNLYIDEYEVNAKHGASIGKFDEDSLFYLQSRGLSIDDSYQLLIKAFLLGILKIDNEIKNKLESVIDNYRR